MTRTRLTKGKKRSFEVRSLFFMDCDRSTTTPQTTNRAPLMKAQGMISESRSEERRETSFERTLPTAAVPQRPEGAFQSKWTRRSRPWNVTVETAVVASPPILETWLFPKTMQHDDPPNDRCDCIDGSISKLSGSINPTRLAGSTQGGSCGQGALMGSRILDSLVQSASGRGRSRGRPLLCV